MSGPELKGQKVVVVGAGRTGQAVAEFLLEEGARVVVTDVLEAGRLGEAVEALSGRGAELELGGHREETFLRADLIVVSPGVPLELAPLKAARAQGVRVTGEIELASRFISAPMVAVTGTNGKTTTTSLLGEIFRAAGRDVFVGGNIGRPLVDYVRRGERAEVVVLEVSSFQLETAESFRPAVAVLLNLTPDHLDRYPDFEAYARAKARIFQNQGPEDWAVLGADEARVAGLPTRSRRLSFSQRAPVSDGAFIDEGRIVVVEGGRAVGALALEELKLIGGHNRDNVMAALLAAHALGVPLETAFVAAAGFRGLAHRLELVGEISGVGYYDDSKGTNVGAVARSLEWFSQPVILIAGGRDKAGDFTPLAELVRERVKVLILLGEAREKMARVLGGQTRTVLVGDMAEAVAVARSEARAGDVVLLSPACASFDMFEDYAHRGRVFAELVRKEAA